MTAFHPVPAFERQGIPPYDDCGACAAIDLANAHRGSNGIPGTLTEINAFRKDAGDEVGSIGAPAIQVGLAKRYNIPSVATSGQNAIVALLGPGKGGALIGRLANFPTGHHLRRSQPSFTGGHVVCVLNDGGGNYWWIDPLIDPQKEPTYKGETVTEAEVRTFLGSANGATIAEVAQGGDMPFKGTGPFIGTFKINPGSDLIDMTNTLVRDPSPWPGLLPGSQAGPEVPFDVVGVVNLESDIDGHPRGSVGFVQSRSEVYQVQRPTFGRAAYALRSNGVFTAAIVDEQAAILKGRQIEWDRQNANATAKPVLAPRPS